MAEISDQKSTPSSSVRTTRPDMQESHTARSDGHGLPATLDLAHFDERLLRTLGCLKALNFQQIAFIGRKLDSIPEDTAYRLLWHEKIPNSERSFLRLKKLAAKRWVLPWQTWSPDRILTRPQGKAWPKKTGVFYVLGREGRRWLREQLKFSPTPAAVEELYLTAIPLARWLTASSCALTLELAGNDLVSLSQAWQERDDTPFPAFKPDFVVTREQQTAFYIYDSPFGLRSEFFMAHIGRGLNFLTLNSTAVVLTRSRESFARIMIAMKGKCLGENRSRVFLGDLETFYKSRGHCIVVNAEDEKYTL